MHCTLLSSLYRNKHQRRSNVYPVIYSILSSEYHSSLCVSALQDKGFVRLDSSTMSHSPAFMNPNNKSIFSKIRVLWPSWLWHCTQAKASKFYLESCSLERGRGVSRLSSDLGVQKLILNLSQIPSEPIFFFSFLCWSCREDVRFFDLMYYLIVNMGFGCCFFLR